MILSGSTRLAASPSQVFRFFETMEARYLDWHPDHRAFRWLGNERLVPGSRFYIEEIIDGALLKRIMVFIRVDAPRLIEFAPESRVARTFLPSVSFVMTPVGDGCDLTQALRIRIGPLGRWLNRRGLAAVERHMREEGENMDSIIAARPA